MYRYLSVAGVIGFKIGSFSISSNSTKELELGAGFLFVSVPGAQYSFLYNIDFWSKNIIPIQAYYENYLGFELMENGKTVVITNKTSYTYDIRYVFIG